MALIQVRADTRLPLAEEPGTGHNRWHPDIPPVAVCAPGDTVVLDTRDAADGQTGPSSGAADLARFEIGRVHPLTGPVHVSGAEPGDLLILEIEDISTGSFGHSTVKPGFGFLRDEFREPFLVHWHLEDGFATSEDIPGVAVPAAPFLGIVGVAPDQRLLALARRREEEACARGDYTAPPTAAQGAVPAGPAGRDGLITRPPRENGGNLDVRQLGPGARVSLPVLVPGALFSVGDAHFAQGDGEVCGLAIETRSTVRLRVDLEPGGARTAGVTQTRFEFHDGPSSPGRPYFVTTGLSISETGGSMSENTTVAARNALRDMIGYLTGRGFSREQAYVLCSVAVDLRISQIANVPHATVSAFLPLDIFI